MLKYYLETIQSIDPNARSKHALVARAEGGKTVQGKRLHQRLAQRTGLREHEVAAVLEALKEEVRDSLRQGERVNLQGLAQFMPGIKGLFRDYDDRVDPKRHQVKVGVRLAPKLNRDINRQLHWERVERPLDRLRPNVIAVFNARQGKPTAVSPGANLKLYGARLKFNHAAPDEGVFLVPPGQFHAQGIRMDEVVVNEPQWVIFQTPYDLPPGEYQIEVRSRLRDNTTVTVGVAPAPMLLQTQASPSSQQAVA
ncbi:DUF4469 domain-containing protein [Cerasicoccus fimbriatus]|uniref:HU family DNA-binding protein n=1 Tax=Cerasicoccus fimbriatus TaxID=3014554 RepID=UPI0022B39E80|nr:DUF4469 domain-containing protein [Cerasicoccus sp. TK19100]